MARSLLSHIGEAFDSYRSEQQVLRDAHSTSERVLSKHTSPVQQILRWFIPNGGTIAVVLVLLIASNAGALTLGRENASVQSSTNTIAYQGRIADSGGNPLTGTYAMTFRLFAAASGGAALWTETWTGGTGVRVNAGLFNVMLGSYTPVPQSVVTANSTLWLGITVGADAEMQPRVQLGSVPFAVQALTVPDGSVTTAKIADGTVTQVKAPTLVAYLGGSDYKILSGTVDKSLNGIGTGAAIYVPFSTAFTQVPLVVISSCTDASQPNWSTVHWTKLGTTVAGFDAWVELNAYVTGNYRGCWIAIGK